MSRSLHYLLSGLTFQSLQNLCHTINNKNKPFAPSPHLTASLSDTISSLFSALCSFTLHTPQRYLFPIDYTNNTTPLLMANGCFCFLSTKTNVYEQQHNIHYTGVTAYSHNKDTTFIWFPSVIRCMASFRRGYDTRMVLTFL